MAIVKNITIEHLKDFPNYLLGEYIELKVMAHYYDDASGPIASIDITTDPQCSILSLDIENFLLEDGFTGGYKKILAKKEGSGVIKVSYISASNELHWTSKQFICQSDFFKTNYLDYLFSSFDKSKIESTEYVKAIFDTLMDMMDLLYAYNEDLKIVSNFSQGKSKFLSLLAKNVGFDRIDFTELNSSRELTSDLVFRDLLNNMLDLLSIRGTKLAYELFFGALGYKISIQEFWYDDEGYLVDIDPIDPTASTFYRYKTDGSFVDSPPVPVPDPRNKQTVGGSVFQNNKSNYIRVKIDSSISSDIAIDPNLFSVEKNLIIKQYLDFLRPSHLQYMTEITPGGSFSDTLQEIGPSGDVGFEESISFGKQYKFVDPAGGTNNFLNDIFGTITEYFVLGSNQYYGDEWSSYLRWDTVSLNFDTNENINWDLRSFLDEELKVSLN